MTKKLKQKIYFTLAIVLIGGMAFAYFHSTRVAGGVAAEPYVETPAFIQLIERTESEVVRIDFTSPESSSYMQPFFDENGVLMWSYSPGDNFLLNFDRTRDKARQAWALVAQEVLHEDSYGLDLSVFGFEPPHMTMEITYEDGSTHTVRIGGQTHDLRHRFMLFDDDPRIFLVSAATAGRLLAEVDALIDMSLPEFTFESAFYFSVWQDGHGLIEFMVPFDKWHEAELNPPGWLSEMTAPFDGFQPNLWSLETIIFEPLMTFRLRGVRALEPECLVEFGLDEPWLIFEHHTMYDGIVIMFGNRFEENMNEFVYLKIGNRPHVFATTYESIQSLVDINPNLHVVRTLTLVNIVDIYGLTITTPDKTFNILTNPSPDDIRAIHPTINGVEVDAGAFRTVYQQIIGISADTTVPLFMPTDTPYITIHYHHFDSDDRSVWLFERDSQFFYASVDGEGVRYVTNRRMVDIMLESLLRLMD